VGELVGEDVGGDRFGGPASRLRSKLKPYGISPKKLRVGQQQFRGYERKDFEQEWKRYLDPLTPKKGA